MIEFFKAIINLAAENTAAANALRAKVGELNAYTLPKDDSSYPAVTYRYDGNEEELVMDGRLENPEILFTGYSIREDSPIEAMEVRDLIVALFDDCVLTVSGYSYVRGDRYMDRIEEDPDGGYNCYVGYRFKIDKQ